MVAFEAIICGDIYSFDDNKIALQDPISANVNNKTFESFMRKFFRPCSKLKQFQDLISFKDFFEWTVLMFAFGAIMLMPKTETKKNQYQSKGKLFYYSVQNYLKQWKIYHTSERFSPKMRERATLRTPWVV